MKKEKDPIAKRISRNLNIESKKSKALPPELVRYNPGLREGLNAYQVAERKAGGLINNKRVSPAKSIPQIIFTNTVTFFNILIFAIAAAIIIFGDYAQLMFLVIVSLNLFIGIFQEISAKFTVEKLSLLTAPKALVVRSGREIPIPVDEIALDEILLIDYGKQISCDSIVIEGEAEVNESLLTGEAIPVKKKPGDMLLGGSFVVSGRVYARVEHINADNYIEKLAAKAKTYKEPKSHLLQTLRRIIRIIGFIIIPLGIATFSLGFIRVNAEVQKLDPLVDAIPTLFDNISKAFLSTAGSVIGMIPSGMFLLTSVALFVSVIKLGRKKTLVREMYSIEMLARVDTLCLDKTGTITDGSMKVKEVIRLSAMKNNLADLLGSYQSATLDNNQTAQAIAELYPPKSVYRPSKVLPFSSSRKYSAVTFERHGTFVLGAPDMIISELPDALEEQIYNYSKKGYRVLLVAHSTKTLGRDNSLPEGLEPALLIIIEDNVRPDAPETIRWFNKNGVAIKIISGDNPVTVSEIASNVGVPDADKYISLEGMPLSEVMLAATKFTVFGRVSPEQKAALVRAMRAAGHTVAMTGDGVNDILAMKEADCAIAMAEGSQAAQKVSQLVLVNNSFANMPGVVFEGRRVINNIQKSCALFLMKTVFAITFSVFILAFGGLLPTITAYPLVPINLMLLEIFVIGIPSFFLAFQPNSDRLEGNFLNNLLLNAAPAGLCMLINAVAVLIYQSVMPDTPQNEVTALLVLGITSAGVVMLFRMCLPFTKITLPTFLSMAAGVIIVLVFMGGLFTINDPKPDFAEKIATGIHLEPMDWMFFLVITQACNSVYLAINYLITRLMRTKRARVMRRRATD